MEWRHYNGDWGGTKYSKLDQINTSNVKELELVWRYRVPDFVEGKNTAIQTNPLMADGILYLITVGQKLVAMKPDTAEVIWMFDPYDGSGATGKTRAMLYWETGDRAAHFLWGCQWLFLFERQNGSIDRELCRGRSLGPD